MKRRVILSLLFIAFNLARADLTLIQKVEGVGPVSEITMKVKGDKVRVDATPEMTTIYDAKTGSSIQLLKAQKTVIRMSAEKMKAMSQLIAKGKEKEKPVEQGKLVATGKTQKVNGYDTEEYVTETPSFKASYWVARSFPNGAAIFQQLQSIKPAMDFGKMGIPEFSNLPGLPIKTVMSMGSTQVTSTLVSANLAALPDTDFAVPPDFKEMEMPDIGNMMKQHGTAPEGDDSTDQP